MSINQDDVIILEKPSSVSFEVIHDVLWQANEENRNAGFVLKTSLLSPEKLQNRIGERGKCYIALIGNKIVGTISVRIVNRNKWYYSGKIPEYMLAAVIPEYQGNHINSKLANRVFEFANQNGYRAIELETASNNKRAIKIYKHQGFELVDYIAKKSTDHHSVVMIKWFVKRPYSNVKRTLMYNIRRVYVKLRYKLSKNDYSEVGV